MGIRSIAFKIVRENEHRGSGTLRTPGSSFCCLMGNLRLNEIGWLL